MGNDGYQLYLRGMELLDEANFEEALNFFYKSLEKEQHFKTYHRIAQTLIQTGNRDEAHIFFYHAWKMNTKNEKVAVDYADSLISINHYIEAKQILDKILKRNPTYGPALQLKSKIII